jgi:eukaryotic-like serine/threonine-protein kinase
VISDRWARVKEIFHLALERPPAERAAFVAEAADDAEVVAEVGKLLAANDSMGTFIERPVALGAAAIRDVAHLAHYEILSTLGSGGMGDVYRARDTKLNRDVALKILQPAVTGDPDSLARLRREARVLASLNHPHIAAIYGVEDAADITALILELVEGPTLADRIAHGPMSIADVLLIARQIAEALEAAHERGVIHRDLKPANIKVRPDGTVKVLDFGIAKALDPPAPFGENAQRPAQPVTQTGVILGSAAYMSPEQVRGSTVDRRSDLWAFGVVLYEMLTGRRMFTGLTASDTFVAVLTTEPDWGALPASTPAAIHRLLRRCLEKDRKQRFESAADARLEIDEALTNQPIKSRATRTVRSGGWRTLPWIAASVLVPAVVLLMWSPWRVASQIPMKVSFQIPPPAGTVEASMFTLSPDGRHLAFVGIGAGPSRLWIRDLESLEPRALAGTEGVTYPFWSPDDQYLGFFAQGKLKKIAVAGGVPVVLCDASDGRGGTWNRDGVIVFSPGPSSPLFRVSAAGGVPAAVTVLAPQDPTASHRFPTFLPDGIHLLYMASSDRPDSVGLYLTSVAGGNSVRLRSDVTNALYAAPAAPGAPGYLLFRHNDTLMAQPFDPTELRATGEMFPVAQDVPDGRNRGFGAFAVSAGKLAYRAGSAVTNRSLVWRDRAGKQLGAIGEPSAFGGGVKLSPNNTTVAMGIFSGSATYLWLHDLHEGALSRFTFLPGKAPVWSPDGNSLVFARQEDLSTTDVYRQAITREGQETLLLHGGINALPFDWSPDGKWIIYQQQDQKTGLDLWLLPLDGDRKPVPYLRTPFNETLAAFSPDGRWVAYQSDESGRMEIYLQTMPTGGGKYQISSSGGTEPHWRGDGKELFYISTDGKLVAVPMALGARIEVGVPEELFAGVESTDYAASRDGQRFLMNLAAGGERTGARFLTVVLNWTTGLKQ